VDRVNIGFQAASVARVRQQGFGVGASVAAYGFLRAGAAEKNREREQACRTHLFIMRGILSA
jgi:hypothetical protein